MIRFRNCASSVSTQIQVLRALCKEFEQSAFTLDDMADAIANMKLLSSHGYSGAKARELNEGLATSRDGVFNNVKMYAEIFRMLGWVTPVTTDSSYPIMITLLGKHVANAIFPIELVKQCFVGIVFPNELLKKPKFSEQSRVGVCMLRAMIDMGGGMYKHELELGPMSVSDVDERDYINKINMLKSFRPNFDMLENYFQKTAKDMGMKDYSVDNLSRFPIALMNGCDLISTRMSKEIFGKSKKCMFITKDGIELYNSCKRMKDLRLEEFKMYPQDIKLSLIRLGMYSMLIRAGFDMTSVSTKLEYDRQQCADILCGRDLLFSPFQTLNREEIEQVEEFRSDLDHKIPKSSYRQIQEDVSYGHGFFSLASNKILAQIPHSKDKDVLAFLNVIDKLYNAGVTEENVIVDKLFLAHNSDKKEAFYPFVATLFKVLGFDCAASRDGDNGLRFDAVIREPHNSIPIEIKSPTEEMMIPIKGVRQALENKIVMLSRKRFNTDYQTTSLVVGYQLPNDRADIQNLINAIYAAYGINIGVLDFRSLLVLAIKTIMFQKVVSKKDIFSMRGIYNARF